MAPRTRNKKTEEESLPMEQIMGQEINEQQTTELEDIIEMDNMEETKEKEYMDTFVTEEITKHEVVLGEQAREINSLKNDKDSLEREIENMRRKMELQVKLFQEQMDDMKEVLSQKEENRKRDTNTSEIAELIERMTHIPKIQYLTEINKQKVELFLCEYNAAKRVSKNLHIQDYILGDAKNILRAKTPELEEDAVLEELEDYLTRLNRYKGNKLRTMLKSNLKWPETKGATLEEKTEIFFNKLNGIISEVGIVGEKYKLVQKDVAYIIINKIPNELLIRKDDIKDDPSLQQLEKLKSLIISKCDTMRRIVQETAPLRKNKIHRIFEVEEDRNTKGEQEETPNWVYRIQQQYKPNNIPQNGLQRNVPSHAIVPNNRKFENRFGNNQGVQTNSRLVCDNCDEPGHAWQFCGKPLDMEKIRDATKRRFLQRREAFYRNNPNNNSPRPNQYNQPLRQNQFNQPPRPNQFPNRWRPRNQYPMERIQVLKENENNCKKVDLEVFDLANGRFTPVKGLLDSGTRLNVAPEALLKYKIRDEQMDREVRFKVPTGQTVQATRAAYLRLQLKYNGNVLDLGHCKFFFIPNFDELLIGDLTMRHFRISPLNAVEHVLNQNE